MAEDFIELGIEGIDKLVDKHFHKLPEKYTDPRTYGLGHRHKHRHEEEESNENENENVPRDEDEESMREVEEGRNRGRGAVYGGGVAYSPPPRRDSYTPRRRQTDNSPPGSASYDARGGYGYGVQPSILGAGYQENRGRERRQGLVRRSSSQPGTLRDDDRERTRGDMGKERRRRRGKSFGDERRSDRVGVGGGNRDRDGGGQNKTEKVVLTLLGAAVGGLAVNAVMDRMDRKSSKGDDMRVGGRARTGGGDPGGGGRDGRRAGKGGGRR
ncbi:hypothetical protein EG329_012716 [Mollisiaceae sp. DMI_Dod_QoI]|nr:hypothetical protein EG329_012716 [Helotiales sp. DMI_Dod_QoI]